MEFEDVVSEALDELPPELAAALRNVAVLIEDECPGEPDLFGLYEGVPLPERVGAEPQEPDSITIFRLPLERSYREREKLREQIRITVLHELGHYFGLEEDRLDELGYG
jgi:predicted Zn-dependent protease with MMP-like domain